MEGAGWHCARTNGATLVNTLLMACGNSLRGDDGVAHEVLRLVEYRKSCHARHVHQWVPELAEEISRFERVVFMDADLEATAPALEPVSGESTRSPLSHASNPAEIVALSRALFGFEGEALLYRLPAGNFAPGEQLSGEQQQLAAQAAGQLHRFLNEADGAAGAADAQPQHQRSTAHEQTCGA
jgi:Ni,Fe-hydrogenase maturation factor